MSTDIKAVISTVGGSVEPLAGFINQIKPEFVVFIASQESIEKIPELKSRIQPAIYLKDQKIMIDDAQDVIHCYRKIIESSKYLADANIKPSQTMADFTGGTKAMSAALLLVAAVKGYRINYTGGNERNKNGLGTVVSGKEKFYKSENPWDALALEDRRRAALMFNRYQFESAGEIFSSLQDRVQDLRLKKQIDALKLLNESYYNWDKFHHRPAFNQLKHALSQLETYCDLTGDSTFTESIRQIKANYRFLEDFKNASEDFRTPCRYHFLDLLANAGRRSEEGKYDDAVARIYRSLEMCGQLALKTGYNFDAGKIPLKNELVLNTLLKMEPSFKEKYRDGEYLKLSLYALFEFLNAMGDKTGLTFILKKTELKKILESRNNSILAHGFSPLNADDFSKSWQLVLDFSGIKEDELLKFPKLPLPEI